MSTLAFLVTELQSLSSETRRKHPEIREAVEKSLSILRAFPEQAFVSLSSDGPHCDDLLRPIFMGCATKNAKVVAISLGSLQRLVSLKTVPPSFIPRIINTMGDAMSQGVDIQLRILQILVSLIPNFPEIHGKLLGEALLLCFKLQESRIAVVSSTAAATLRQLVMFVMDKMVAEDRITENEDLQNSQLVEVHLPDGSTKELYPSSMDSFSVFEDLCLLANSEKPHFLNLEFLHKTFALELIESVLTNYYELFRKRSELILLLRHHLCPLLLKSLSDRPQFSLSLRCTRVVFLLLKQFSLELQTESEVFLTVLIRVITGESISALGDHEVQQASLVSRPYWLRVLAVEIMRGLCSDAELLRNLWERYDAQGDGPKVVSALITALKRLVTEKPALLGQSSYMSGIGVQAELPTLTSASSTAGAAAYGLDMAGRVASATVSGVAGMIGVAGSGLSVQGSSMKLQCIDQLDKTDAPAIPETYIYLLAVQCIVSLCEGFVTFSSPIYSSLVSQLPRAAGDPANRLPPALNFDILAQENPQVHHLRIVQSIISQSWPALLAALSFIIATNLSDELFVEVLASYQAMTNVSGMLGLATPRDAFINSLSKFAVPTRVMSSLEVWVENPPASTPRSATAALTEGLGLSGPTQPPSLSERNMACLKVFVGCSLFLAGTLGESWYSILEVLQNADSVLGLMIKTGGIVGSKKGLFGGSTSSSTIGGTSASKTSSLSGSQSQSSGGAGSGTAAAPYRHPLLLDLDLETMQLAIQRLFDSSRNLEDNAFKDFVDALCKLSAEMVGTQTSDAMTVLMDTTNSGVEGEEGFLTATLNASQENVIQRRRVSGIYIPKTSQKSGDFGIAKLGGIATLNVHRLIYRPPDIAWNTITGHLLMVIQLPYAPQTIRIQAARVLDEILLLIPRHLPTSGNLQSEVQYRVLEVLSHQVILDLTASQQTSTDVELRRMGLEILHQILQAAGHTLVVGWEIIFKMLESACWQNNILAVSRVRKPSRSESTDSLVSSQGNGSSTRAVKAKPLPLQIGLGNPTEKSYSALVKIAFQSLTIVCDSVSSLSPEHIRLCISTLGQFGRQTDTNIALTAAASLLWSVSDAIQSKRKNVDDEPQYSELWMFLLLEVLGLCTDPRAEVRDGAIQTLFRTMQLYGATLSAETWDQCIQKITLPLLQSLTTEVRKLADPGINHDQSITQAWDESKILAFTSVGSILSDFLVSKIMFLDSFTKAWDVFVGHVEDTVLLENRIISPHALRCLERGTKALASSEVIFKMRVTESLERAWQGIDRLGKSVTELFAPGEDLESLPNQPLTQEALVAFVEVIQSTRDTSKNILGKEWELSRLKRLMAILRGVLTYPYSPDYRPDIDGLSPVQAIVLNTVQNVDLTVPGSPSLVIHDLSQYATLAFVAAFDVLPHPKSQIPQTPQKRITYVAVSKKTMPLLVDLFIKFRSLVDIYNDGTLEGIFSAYAIPIKMKYECPNSSKFGKDPPLWKTATLCFLAIVKECTSHLQSFGSQIPNEKLERIWRQMLNAFRGGILADCSSAETFSLDVQETEEDFDFALVASLEKDVVPYLGDARVPDELIAQLGQILAVGSKIYDSDVLASLSSRLSLSSSVSTPPSYASRTKHVSFSSLPHSTVDSIDIDARYSELGSSHLGKTVLRERFSYWCFDLLFLICSGNHESSRRRLAALSLPSLLNRCRTALLGFIADESLRGNMPFPRAREEELLYCLRKLLELRLYPGSLWAALSNNPSQYCIELPDYPLSQTPRQLIADSVKRSIIAHLFHFYPLLCEVASMPRKTPFCWRQNGSVPGRHDDKPVNGRETLGEGDWITVGLDARDLARDCLEEIGREIGLSS